MLLSPKKSRLFSVADSSKESQLDAVELVDCDASLLRQYSLSIGIDCKSIPLTTVSTIKQKYVTRIAEPGHGHVVTCTTEPGQPHVVTCTAEPGQSHVVTCTAEPGQSRVVTRIAEPGQSHVGHPVVSNTIANCHDPVCLINSQSAKQANMFPSRKVISHFEEVSSTNEELPVSLSQCSECRSVKDTPSDVTTAEVWRPW